MMDGPNRDRPLEEPLSASYPHGRGYSHAGALARREGRAKAKQIKAERVALKKRGTALLDELREEGAPSIEDTLRLIEENAARP